MITIDYTGDYEPIRGSKFAAAYDLKATATVEIRPGELKDISTGICAQPPLGYAGLLFIRSGMSKRGLRLSTGVSVIDPDYTGEIICCVRNDSEDVLIVREGDRIAQIMYVPFMEVHWNRVDKLKKTERGDGGFGSTGK